MTFRLGQEWVFMAALAHFGNRTCGWHVLKLAHTPKYARWLSRVEIHFSTLRQLPDDTNRCIIGLPDRGTRGAMVGLEVAAAAGSW